jgi:hypothetical protein
VTRHDSQLRVTEQARENLTKYRADARSSAAPRPEVAIPWRLGHALR